MRRPFRYGLALFLIVSLVNLIVLTISFLILKAFRLSYPEGFIVIFVFSVFSGFLISYFIVNSLPIIKDILSTFRILLRLESLTHPLLVKLSGEAPGTYHHSILVSNLATKAAKSIGADTLLVRVGAYYHDIGKLSRPSFFIENAIKLPEKIKNPTKVAQGIIGHTNFGLKLAKEYNLPAEVKAFIPEHHGTTKINYLYAQAKEKNPQIQKAKFTYPGPKPMSKESAILMLADGVEAKIRSLNQPTDEEVKKTVESIIEARVNDGQLELSGLDQEDIAKINQSFTEYLIFMLHRRHPYPETLEK